jgi:hypothetical protein
MVRWDGSLDGLQPSQRRIWMGVCGNSVAALIGRLFWYGPAHRLADALCRLDPEDARQMAQILTQAQIPLT